MGGGTSPPSSLKPTSTHRRAPAGTEHSGVRHVPARGSISALPLRIITHNIRYATTSPFPGEAPWQIRKPLLCAQLLYTIRPTLLSSIIFLQEVLYCQLVDIRDSLSTHSDTSWTSVGRGRDDGHQAGEFSPIFFNTHIWDVIDGSSETIWLNSTGAVGKKGWDAASVRIMTTIALTHRPSGKKILLINTHLDDQGSISRAESAKILIRECHTRRRKFDVDAVALGGDLNSEPDGDAYPILANYEGSGLVDMKSLAEGEEVYGEESTFTGFDGDRREWKRIDFLFLGRAGKDVSNKEGVAYAVSPNRFENGVYLSDHRAVVADVLI